MRAKKVWQDSKAIESQRKENQKLCLNLNKCRSLLEDLGITVTDQELTTFWNTDTDLVKRVLKEREESFNKFYSQLPVGTRPQYDGSDIATTINKIWQHRKDGMNRLFNLIPTFVVCGGVARLAPDFSKQMEQRYSVYIDTEDKESICNLMEIVRDSVKQMNIILQKYYSNINVVPISNKEPSFMSVIPNMTTLSDRNEVSLHYKLLNLLDKQ